MHDPHRVQGAPASGGRTLRDRARILKPLPWLLAGLVLGLVLAAGLRRMELSPLSFRRPAPTHGAEVPGWGELSWRGAILRRRDPLTLRLFAPDAVVRLSGVERPVRLRLENVFPQAELAFEGSVLAAEWGGNAVEVEVERPGTLRVLAPEKRGFSFVALGDPHCRKGEEMGMLRDALLSLVSASRADFAVLLGDLVNNEVALLQDLADVLAKLPFPTYTIVGNHDYESPPGEGFAGSMAPLNYSFAYAGALFLAFNNAGEFPPAWCGSADYERVLGRLEAPAGRSVIFLCHKPLMDGRQGRDHHMNVHSVADALKDEISAARVDLVLSGHINHWYMERVEDTLFVTAGEGLRPGSRAALVRVASDGAVDVEAAPLPEELTRGRPFNEEEEM